MEHVSGPDAFTEFQPTPAYWDAPRPPRAITWVMKWVHVFTDAYRERMDEIQRGG